MKIERAEAIKAAEKIQGWMSNEELGCLYDRASQMESVIEIGSWRGRSSYALAAALLERGGVLFCVDHFRGSLSELSDSHQDAKTQDIYAQFVENVRPLPNIIAVKEDSCNASKLFNTPVDMVFIDGEHTEPAVTADIEAWKPKTRKLLCGHDLTLQGVSKALDKSGLPFKRGAGSIWYVEIGK